MRVTLVTICLLLLATGALAQSDRGTITGAVNDPNGAVVARAEVIVRNVATGTEYKTVTTETGNYTISSLPAGSYELRVEAPGFKKFVLQKVQVHRCGQRHRHGYGSNPAAPDTERRTEHQHQRPALQFDADQFRPDVRRFYP
jgi:Carboxypeptidase regulatory-like domain